jgi:hypothetical protein
LDSKFAISGEANSHVISAQLRTVVRFGELLFYVTFVVTEQNPKGLAAGIMIKATFIFLMLTSGTLFSRAATADLYANIGQPSIFWRDGEWQMFKDGRWVPYGATKPEPSIELQSSPEPMVLPEPQPESVDTNAVYYDWSYGLPFLRPIHHHRRFDKERRFKRDKDSGPKSLTDTSIGNIGRTTIGIGKQSGGLGQRTIGIGQPNAGIGQTTIGIGQPTIGIGKPTIGIGQQVHAVPAQSHVQSEHVQGRR